MDSRATVTNWLQTWMQDLRLALRSTLRWSTTTVGVILMLAVGMGMTTALVTVAAHAYLHPLPYPSPEPLLWLQQEVSPGEPGHYVSTRELRDLQGAVRTLDVAGFMAHDANVGGGDRVVRANCAAATARLFPILGAKPLRGRLIEDADDQRGAAKVVVLSRDFWQKQFHGDESALGRDILVNGEPHRVVGILPARFRMVNPEGHRYDAWLAGALDQTRWRGGPVAIVHSIGRIRPGYGLSAVNQELASLKSLQKKSPRAIVATPWMDVVRRNERTPLLLLLAAVAIVLLVSCVNAASLLLTRALGRQREISVRCALGAGGARIVRQMLTETMLLGAVSAVLGLLIAFLAKDLLTAYLVSRMPELEIAPMNWTALEFAFALGIGTSILFGLVPALEASRLMVDGPVRAMGHGTAGRGAQMWRRGLVVASLLRGQ